MSPTAIQLNGDGDRLRVVQITDTHLNRIEGGTLVGLNTDFSLQHVIDRVKRERQAIDLVLGTGDISDHGSEEAYSRARDYFAQLNAPVLWLPGNHDRTEIMAAVLGQDGELVRTACSEHWMVVMLNSQIPGEVGGRLGAEELAALEICLAEANQSGQHVLVCLHHQPLPMGSAWIDQQMVEDSSAFFACIEQSSQVRAVLWGHVHQELDAERSGIRMLSTPSSCIQFAPQSDDFKIDDMPPGYRWLDLLPDGTIETGVSRVTDVAFDVDLDSDGYL